MKRYLSRNERSGTPTSFVAFDVETKPGPERAPGLARENLFWLGYATAWRIEGGKANRIEEASFASAADMRTWLYNRGDPRKRTWLFSHNLGFDLTAIQFWRLLENGALTPVWRRRGARTYRALTMRETLDQACVVLEDPPTILDLESQGGRRLCFVDLMNYYPMALAEIGAALGLEKLPMPGDEASDGDWLEYVRRDVHIVRAAVCDLIAFVKGDDLGNLRYTMSGQSMAMFRHRCMTDDILLGHDDEVKADERLAYYGMQPRCYFVGRVPRRDGLFVADPPENVERHANNVVGPVYRLDVNSCYPFVMRDNDFPVEYLHSDGEMSARELEIRLEAVEGCAHVLVESTATVYPCRQDGETRWMTGRFATWLAGPELRAALARKHVAAVYAGHFYRRARPFRKFVDSVWKLRAKYERNGLRLRAISAKMLSVSLHGKLGQKNQRWECIPNVCPPVPWGTWTERDALTGEYSSWRSVGGLAQRRNKPCETSTSFPLIAAYVTSYGRLLLGRIIDIAGRHGVYYWDADSVHTTLEGFVRLTSAGLVDSRKPGSLKIEKIADDAEYRGPKNYRMGDEWVRAGVRARTRIDERGLCHDTHFHGLTATLNGEPPAGPLTEEVAYNLPVGKIDGIVGRDGWVNPPRYVEVG